MREPKFRAWSKKHNKYLKITGIQYDGDKFAGVFVVYGTIAGMPNTIFLEPEDVILEQYTGLKDKNGKEIYEGDIINVVGIGIAQVIDSPSGEWMLYYKREPDEIKNGFACVVPKNKPSGLWKATLTSYIEIVGNIHENVDLLKGEE